MGRVRMSAVEVTISGHTYSFNLPIITISVAVRIIGLDSGTTMVTIRRRCPAPSISAACRMSLSIVRMYWNSRNIAKALAMPGRMMPA